MRKQALDLGEAIDPLESLRMVEAEPLEAVEAEAAAAISEDATSGSDEDALRLSSEVKDILKASWQSLQDR